MSLFLSRNNAQGDFLAFCLCDETGDTWLMLMNAHCAGYILA